MHTLKHQKSTWDACINLKPLQSSSKLLQPPLLRLSTGVVHKLKTYIYIYIYKAYPFHLRRDGTRGGIDITNLHLHFPLYVKIPPNKNNLLQKRKTMQIEFTEAEKEVLVQKIKGYFESELSQEIGQFDAEFLLDFFGKEIGAYYYNHGLTDAQDIFKSRVECITDAIYELEVPTEFSGK